MKGFKKNWLPSGLAIVFLATLLVILYRNTITNNGFVTYVNYARHYPKMVFLKQALALKEIPLWNPYLRFGSPFADNPIMLPLYPLTFLPFLFSQFSIQFLSAYNIYIFLHYLVSVLSMYFLARYHRCSQLAAIFAAIVYHFALATAYLKRDELYLFSYAWLPLIVLLTLELFQTKKIAKMIFYLIPISIFLNFSFGYYQFYYFLVLLAGFIFVNHQYFKQNGRLTLFFTKKLLFLLLLLIPLLLPNLAFVNYYQNTPRALGEEWPSYNWLSLLANLRDYPLYNFGNQKASYFLDWHYLLGPVGALPLLFFIYALVGKIHQKYRIIGFYYWLLFACLVYFLLFVGFSPGSFGLIPQFSSLAKGLAKHNRVFVLFLITVAVTAAFGFDHLAIKIFGKAKRSSWQNLFLVLIIAATLIGFLPHYGYLFDASNDKEIAFIGGSKVLKLTPEELEFLKKDKGLYRVYGFFNNSLSPVLYQLYSPDGRTQTKAELTGFYAFWDKPEKSLGKENSLDLFRYDLANVKYFLLKDSFWEQFPDSEKSLRLKKMVGDIYLNEDYWPRAVLFSSYQFVPGKIRSSLDIEEGDKRTIILSELPSLTYSGSDLGEDEYVKIKSYGFNAVGLEVAVSENRIVLLSDTYYDGWQAFLDGQKTRIIRAFNHLRAVEVPPGRHQLLFEYKPAMIVYLKVYLVAVAILLTLAWCYRKHQWWPK